MNRARKWFRKYRNVFNFGISLTIAGLIFALFVFIRSEAGSRQIIDSLKIVIEKQQGIQNDLEKIVEDQRRNLEKLRVTGRLPALLSPQPVIRDSKNAAELASIDAKHVKGTRPKQFIIHGTVENARKNRSLWIGTYSGLQFWPQIELPQNSSTGDKFQYRITVPSGVESGSLVLIEAGPSSSELFAGHTLSSIRHVGLYWPNLGDVSVLWSVNFQ